MSGSEVFLGIDCGTQSTKAVLYHPSSRSIKARAAAAYDLDPCDTSKYVGRAEQHPHKWIRALHLCLKELSPMIQQEGYEICGVGVSGQQHGMVPLDENFQVIRSAKLWCDIEAASEAKEFSEKATKVMQGVVGPGCTWSIPPGFTAPKVLWMKKNEPELFEKVKWLILPHDYINLCLSTGLGYDMKLEECESEDALKSFMPSVSHIDTASVIPTTDAGDASGTGLLHPQKPEYVQELAKIIDDNFESCLPKILSPNAISGYLSSHWKEIMGMNIEDEKPIPISVGTGDNMASAMGCKCTESGSAVLSLGTSGTIFGVSETPVTTGTPVAHFNDATGRHLPLVCVMSCTGVLNSVLEHWCSTPNAKLSHSEATKLAEDVPPGCHGLTFLPYLGGERTPDWPHAFGALLGVSPQNMDCMAGGKPGVMYRCALESITYLMADALEQMRKSCGQGFQPKLVFVVGGGSKNKFWRQMLANVLGVELTFPTEPESAALGAAFQAGAAATGMRVDEYIAKQEVEIEDCIVKPTTDEPTLILYRESLERYRLYSNKLFE
jgi:xylulokinase